MTALIIGYLFGWIAAGRRRANVLRAPAFACGFAAAALFSAAAALCYVRYPDWMWMYFVSPKSVPAWLLVFLFAFIYGFPYMIGYTIPALLKNARARAILFVALLGAQIAELLLLLDRYFLVTTFEKYPHEGTPLLQSELNGLLSLLFPCVIAAGMGLWFLAKRLDRKEATDARG